MAKTGLLLLIALGIFNITESKNVLLILADDGGFEMGAYRNKICQTPNLDKLAKDSLIFNNAYTSVSSCSPSRSAILTGQPAHQNGMYGLHQGVHNFNSFSTIKSLPNRLREHGITSGIIGKKHVGPSTAYKFDYEQTEENNSILQVGRNITKIKLLVREFLNTTINQQKPFFLLVAFHDPHRCGHTNPEYGEFCQHFGNGDTGMGVIPDWAPIYYQPDELQLPYFLPDTNETRYDVAAQYTTISRLDQGVGLVLQELENYNISNETLVIYTSDNGIPFPNGRTNFYDSGIGEPMLISSPFNKQRQNQVTYSLTSLLDVVPTVLDWFGLEEESNEVEEVKELTGKSLLPLLAEEPTNTTNEAIFGSHVMHEVTMYYPMRMIRTHRYKLIHNLNYYLPFPIDQDLYLSRTFQDVLERTLFARPLPWFKTLKSYYQRPEVELYDLKMDPEELKNLAGKPSMRNILAELKAKLRNWQIQTKDPWICAPHSILEDNGPYKSMPSCCLVDDTGSVTNSDREVCVNVNSFLF